MKQVFFLTFTCWLCLQSAQAQWNSVKPSDIFEVHDANFISDTKGLLLTSDSLSTFLQITTNGGQNWTSKALPSWTSSDPMYWQGICFLDEQNGYVFGNWLVNGGVFAGGTESFVLYHTQNGGDTWEDRTPQAPTVGFANLNDIHFFNAQQGVLTYSTGLGYTLVHTTDDGGVSWQTQDTLRSWEVDWHLNPDGAGYAIRYNHDHQQNVNTYILYRIENYGKTWTLLGKPGDDPAWPQQRIGMWYDSRFFVNEQLGFRARITGGFNNIIHLDRTDDGGQSWQEDYFVNEVFPIQQLSVQNQTIWLQTWVDVFRRSLTIGLDDPMQKQSILIYPSPLPAGGTLQVDLTEKWNGTVLCRIVGMDGKIHHQQQIEAEEGRFTVEMTALPPALYQLSVQYDAGRKAVALPLVVVK